MKSIYRNRNADCVRSFVPGTMVAFSLLVFGAAPAFPGDWGYEGAPELPRKEKGVALDVETGEPQKAPAALRLDPRTSRSLAQSVPKAVISSPKPQVQPVKAVPEKVVPVKDPVAPVKVESQFSAAAQKVKTDPAEQVASKSKQAVVLWLRLFQGVAKHTLTPDQSRKIETFLSEKEKLGGKPQAEVLSILRFFPRFSEATASKPELESAYCDLFRALLRMRERQAAESLNLKVSEIRSDSDLITELLGMERIAVAGDPPFAEDAVEAYADMACFVYEQKHPGRTVDATDNRALFARVVADKFRNAPGEAEKRAMARFDLSWAKFRILWEGSTEAARAQLVESLSKSGADSSLKARRDPVLELVLTSWPWPVNP